MGDSDDEYDRKRRDKFRGERAEASYRGTERVARPREEWPERESWSRPRPREYRTGVRDRGYSPSMDPAAKRARHDYYGEGYYNHYAPYHQPPYRDPSSSSQSEGQQPPMMSFKAFLATQDDNISDNEAIEKYNDYKLEFQRQQLNEFFVAHKDDEWFRLKYHPEDSVKRKAEQMASLKKRVDVFLSLLKGGKIDVVTVDCAKTNELLKLLDTVVIKLEGGSDEDLAQLEQEYEEMEQKYREQKAKEAEAEKVQKAKEAEALAKKEEGEIESEKAKPVEDAKTNGEPDDKKEDGEHDKTDGECEGEEKSVDNDNQEEEEKKDEEKATPVEEEEEEQEKKLETEEDTNEKEAKMDVEEEKDQDESEKIEAEPVTAEVQEKEPVAEKDTVKKDRKRKRSYSGSSSSSSSSSDSDDENEKKDEQKEDNEEKDNGKEAEKTAEEEQKKEDDDIQSIEDEAVKPKPKSLHKTTSIFLRNLAPTITKQEVDAMCSRYDGFLRVALADPQPDRRWLRRGWVTFKRDANIKEICWNLNNIRLRECELGAIVNRDLSRRIRPVNGITAHKTVVRSDIRVSAKVTLHLDNKAGLWLEDDEAKPKPTQTFGLVSNNPVLHNITDYLIEEASAEEEELLGLEPSSETQDAVSSVERDEHLIKVLDRIVLYLRIVHSVDYYNHCEYPNEDEMPNRCGILHARGPPPTSKTDMTQFIGSTVEAKMSAFLPDKPKEEGKDKNEAKLINLALKDVETEVDKFVQANTRELAKDKWLCPLSGKKFKGPDFVRKHIFNKHAEKIEEVKKEVEFFNNYLRDPKRPMLAEAPHPKREEAPAYNNPYGGYGGPGGYGRPPPYFNQGFPQRSRGYQPRTRGGPGDFRPVIHYRDLDAPREPEEFI